MATKAKTIDEYLEGVSPDQRAALEGLRHTIHLAAPGSAEVISYGLPAFRLDGKVLVGFGATSTHCALYLFSGSTVAAHQDDGSRHDATAQHAGKLADGDRDAFLGLHADLADAPRDRAPAQAAPGGSRSGILLGDDFLDHRVERAALRAFAHESGGDASALLADVTGVGFGFWHVRIINLPQACPERSEGSNLQEVFLSLAQPDGKGDNHPITIPL